VIQDVGYRDAYPDLVFTPGAAILTRVVSRPTQDTFTLDLGTKAVACDPPLPRVEVIGFEDAETVMQNEEHLVLRVPLARIPDIPEIGSVLFALPVHVCPTTTLYPSVPAVENGKVVEWWDVSARNRKITI
jgi:D-serine deaminase-like pyridoxal phosphate-dependent protein